MSLLYFWQHLPLSLSPEVFTFGPFSLYWYAIFFLLGSFVVFHFAKKSLVEGNIFESEQYTDFAFWFFITTLIFAKLGFLFFYWLPFTVGLSSSLYWPWQSGVWHGLPGMSFFGGALGAFGYTFWYVRKNKKDFLVVIDTIVLWLPLGIFFGRLGNFFHNELIGRVTSVPWGMYFPGEAFLRHPSTLYAAALEGLLLFIIIFLLRKNNEYQEARHGILTAWFCILYGLLRFCAEFFRQPDAQIGYIGILTINQILSLSLAFFGALLLTKVVRGSIIHS
jgi:phosphatidylglycerol:prolipoprotein diacylglycerol transferase